MYSVSHFSSSTVVQTSSCKRDNDGGNHFDKLVVLTIMDDGNFDNDDDGNFHSDECHFNSDDGHFDSDGYDSLFTCYVFCICHKQLPNDKYLKQLSWAIN